MNNLHSFQIIYFDWVNLSFFYTFVEDITESYLSSLGMLNRRLLRIKVAQALFGLQQSNESNYELGFEEIEAFFQPDLNSMEYQDPELFKAQRAAASKLYKQYVTDKTIKYEAESPEIIKAVEKSYNQFVKRNGLDATHFLKQMKEDVDNIFYEYLLILKMFIDLSDYVLIADDIRSKKLVKQDPVAAIQLKFSKNTIIEVWRKNEQINQELVKKNVKVEPSLIKSLYNDFLLKDEIYIAYCNKDQVSIQEEKELLLYLLKNIILKSEPSASFLEMNDLNWTENESIVKNLLVKTIKKVEVANINDQSNLLLEVSSNWEEDYNFFIDLYDIALKNREEITKWVNKKLKNWDEDRIALMDKIILWLATAEMIHFSSIPTKVTINEFIEISKIYSTPKSKQFVNGILDSLAKQLTEEGIIKKSGRGLIDNK